MKTFCLTLLFAVLAACTISPQGLTYYQFESATIADNDQAPAIQPQLLVVEKPQLLGILSQQGIAMRYDGTRLKNANYHLWSDDPSTMLMNMAQLQLRDNQWTALTRYQFQPLSNSNRPHYQLSWQLDKFNGTTDGTAEISGQWQLYFHYDASRSHLLAVVPFSHVNPIPDEGYGALVTSLQTTWSSVIDGAKPKLLEIIQQHQQP